MVADTITMVADRMTTAEQDWSALMRAALTGDARAYARFLHAVTPVLRGIVRARGMTFPPEAQEDIVQEVLLAVHLKRHTWRTEAPIRPWLYAITRHKIVDTFRARGKHVQLPIEDFAELIPATEAADPTERDDALRLLGELDPRSAALMRSVALDGMDATEAGGKLGLTRGATRVVLHRGLKRLAALRERRQP